MTLFNRHGQEHHGPHALDAKGAAYIVRARLCRRCGGAGGSEAWRHTGYTCYDCGGRGSCGTETVKLYSAEQLAKLNARKAKADAKRAAAAKAKADKAAAEAAANAEAFRAAHAELIAKSAPHMANEFIGDVMGRALAKNDISEKQEAAVLAAVERIEARAVVAAASNHVGTVGKRFDVAVTVDRVASFARPAFRGYGAMETVWIVTMRDADGNAIVTKSSVFSPEKGERFTLRATVKEHSEYNGEKQTIVNRAKIIEPATGGSVK
jgi:hypothetical protein